MRLPCLVVLSALWACAPPEDGDVPLAPYAFLPDGEAGPADPALVDADGVLLDRITVLWAPEADAAAVEAALAAVSGTLGSSRPGMPWTTVRVPPAADRAAAQALVDAISDAPGVRYARVAWQPAPPRFPEAPLLAAPSLPEANGNPALGAQRFFGAWSASKLATTQVPVYVADLYAENAALPQLSSLRFVGPAAPVVQVREDGSYAGNHGFWVASLLGADADGRTPIGTHPAPSTTLDLAAVNVLGVGEVVDLHLALDRALPTSTFFVLNTSLGLPDDVPALDRVMAALSWREVVLRRTEGFLHTASAGNEGLTDPAASRLNSEWSAQAGAADLRTLLTGDDREAFEDAWTDAVERSGGGVAGVAGHTLIVGAADSLGAQTAFSNRGADVQMIGVDLIGACSRKDSDCADTPLGRLMDAGGTSGAAPQVAGLAAWLRAVDPTLDAAELRARLLTAFDGRWVDALTATLALERPDLPVRLTLLDQDDNGVFNEADTEAVAVALVEGDAADPTLPPTWPRADLNGDGRVRSDTRARYDLDGDGQLQAISVNVPGIEPGTTTALSLQEEALSDRDVLCWAAYGGMFTGSAEARDALVRSTCQGLSPATTLAAGMVFEGEITSTFDFDGTDCLTEVDGVCFSSRRTVVHDTLSLTGVRIELFGDEGLADGDAAGTGTVSYQHTSELRHAPYCTEDSGSDSAGVGVSDLAGSEWTADTLSVAWRVHTIEEDSYKAFGGVDFFGDPCVPFISPATPNDEDDEQDSSALLFDTDGNVIGVSFVRELVSDSVDADGFGGLLTELQVGTLRRTR
jgi:hypothetical protein